MRRLFPQHFAFCALGFATGLRPSSLRPLRRRGPSADVLWDEGTLLVRRSHTLGDEVMEKTKTGARQRIALPPKIWRSSAGTWTTDAMTRRYSTVAADEQRAALAKVIEIGGFRTAAEVSAG